MTHRQIIARAPKGYEPPKRAIFARAQNRSFDVQASSDEAVITLYDEIGYWGVTASAFRQTLDAIEQKKINLRINSPGGEIFAGIAMYNDLVAHPAEIRVTVTGLAASAASLVMLGGDTIEIAQNGFVMIHNAWGVSVGSKADMRAYADVLDEIDGVLRDTYVQRTGLKADEITSMMDAETWLKGQAAVDKKFADRTSEAEEPVARFDLSLFQNAPRGLRGNEPAKPQTARDLEATLRDAGVSQTEAKAAIAQLVADERRSQRDVVDHYLLAAMKQLTETIGG